MTTLPLVVLLLPPQQTASQECGRAHTSVDQLGDERGARGPGCSTNVPPSPLSVLFSV